MADDADPYIGKRLADRYDILWKLGEGGMARVYAARHAHLGRNVAIKLLLGEYVADSQAAETILREAKVMGGLGHPNICEARDAGVTSDGTPFLVLEMLTGRPLGREIERVGQLQPSRVVEIALQVASAMGAAHDLGIVHRDLKPDNVFLLDEREGDRDRVKVLDFGIAKQPQELSGKSSLTSATRAVGTPGYMAPETLTAPSSTDRRADVYSLGAVMYECLAGQPPYAGIEVPDVFRVIVDQDPTPLRELAPDVTPALIRVIETAIARDPDARYPTMASFSDALRQLGLAGVRTTGISAVSSRTGVHAAPPRRTALGLIAGIVGVLVVGGAAFLATRHTAPATPAAPVTPVAPAAEIGLEMRSPVAGARASIRGREYPLPIQQRLSRNGQPEMVEVTAPNMTPRRMWLTFDRDQMLEVTLEPIAAAAAVAATSPQPAAPVAPVPAVSRHGLHPTKSSPAPAREPATVAVTPAPAPVPVPVPVPVAAPPITTTTTTTAKPAPVPAPKPAGPIALPANAIREQLAAHHSAIDQCIAEDPAATGRLVYRLVVAATGRVEAAQLIQADRRFPAVERCLARSLQGFSFAAPGQAAETRAVIELD